jgi:hypothetical protein
MEIILTILVVSTLNVVCFLFGAKVGQKVDKGESIEIPTLNPLEAYREHKDRKEAEREQDKIATIMHNIETYDGTGNGQRDVR